MSTPEKWTLLHVAGMWEVLDAHGNGVTRSKSPGEAVRLALHVAMLFKVPVEIVDGRVSQTKNTKTSSDPCA